MKNMMPGMFSGKVFRGGTNPNKEGVQYGPNTSNPPSDPLDELAKKTMGKVKSNYEPNGLVYLDPSKIVYLKS